MKNRHCSVFVALVPLMLVGIAHADGDTSSGSSAPSATSLSEVVIQTSRDKGDYRVNTLDSIGPLGTTPMLDAPYSISVLPSDLIENTQAVDFKEVSKYMPLVSYQEQQGPDILRPMTRGMQGGNFQNTKIDGMQVFFTGVTSMEQFDQIEVISGAAGSLYGPAPPSGMFNFITKRPTDYDLRELTATYASDSLGTLKADMGGNIDPGGIVSYRLNTLYGSGDGFVDESHERRTLVDLGVDVRPWAHTTLELNYSSNVLDEVGFPGWFTYADAPQKNGQYILLPPSPNPQDVGYGQSYAGVYLRTTIGEARIKQDFGDNWHLVAGILNQDVQRDINTAVNNLTSDAGAYTTSFGNGFAPRFLMTSDVAYLNGNFDTFGIGHDLTLGSAGYRASSYSPITAATAASVLLGTASIVDPAVYPEPPQGPPNVSSSHIYDSSDVYQQGFNLGDTLKFNDYWMLRAGASQDWFHTDNFSNKSVLTTEYSNHGISPTGSVIFKPASNMSVYATYTNSLQAGDLAPAGTVNAGDSLAPYRSKQYEVGYKADFNTINVTAALFDLERPFANINPLNNTFEITGTQANKGLELSAVGNVVSGLTVYGGITLLHSILEDTPLLTTNDKLYVGTPKVKGNVLFEYHLPTVPGLVATLDYQFSGPRPGDDSNQFTVAGYNLIDVGGRYTRLMWGTPVAWRLAVDNVADRHYWSTIGPSNITGANTGSEVAHMGAPRTLEASVTVKF
jgi:iron complex outermembrane recepter protein